MGRIIQGDKHFIAWSGILQNDEGMLFKVNDHCLKIFLKPKKPPEDLDEVDFLILP